MDPFVVEHIRFLNCCAAYKPFNILPKYIQHAGINVILGQMRDKSFSLVDNTVNWEAFHNLAFILKINIDVNSSINLPSGNDHLVRGLKNYLFFIHLAKHNVINKKSFMFLKKHLNMISPHDVLKMNVKSFNEANNKKYIDNIRKRTEEKIEHKTTRMYFCVKCQNRKTRVQEMQLRCGDEGGTLFIECVVCGHRWKKGS
jgi:DNA-directed RNA polymerase subunit M/transcription elongation factor TFIIS